MPNSLFIQPVYRQNRLVFVGWGFHFHIFNQMDFGQFLLNFTEFDQFFLKPTKSEGADFLVSAGFLNTGPTLVSALCNL
jgi:hypothetical protein